jgi:multidrug transporter EmrE-like cation transporter
LIWLAPAAFSSIAIALILKVNERRGGSRILIAGANYLVASAISFLLLAWGGGASRGHLVSPGAATLALGGAAGVIYVLGFLLLMAGIGRLPLAVPVTVARLSVVLPIAVSTVLWHESPGFFPWLGIALGLLAIILFGRSLAGSGRVSHAGGRSSLIVASLFVVLGLGDVVLKAFRELAPDVDRLAFTCILFAVAAVLTWLLVLVRRIAFDRRTFCLGLLLGVPNLCSTIFTLRALRSVPASIAFPFINLTVIAGTTVLGLLIWRERLSRLGFAALVLAVCALLGISLR